MKKIATVLFLAAVFGALGHCLYFQSVGKIGFSSAAGLALIWLSAVMLLLCVSIIIFRKTEKKK